MPQIKGLLDCHSLQGTGPAEAPDAGRRRYDITLGNNGRPDGKKDPARGELTCTPAFMNFVRQVFEGAGFSVSINFSLCGWIYCGPLRSGSVSRRQDGPSN